jgi:DNA-binding beta-propeller fold protein YncE
MMLDRRHFLLTATGLAACGRDLAKPFNGAAYIASHSARTVSIVNLSRFKLSKQVALDAEPTAVLTSASRVYVLTPSNGTVTELDAAQGTVARRYRLASSAVSMRLSPDGRFLWLLARDPQALIQLDLKSQRIGRTIKLAKSVLDFDLSKSGLLAVIGSPATLINLETGRTERELEIQGDTIPIRFRPDGKQVLAAHSSSRIVSIADVETGRLLVKLPMPLEPERFCFTLDNGGQMFVTGRGMDAVVIVSPYQTAVDETLLAGRAPGSMTVDADNLYVANPETGDLTVIAIADRRLLAKISVGQDPVQVMVTPDNQYVLVLNHGSSDLSVIRVSKIGSDLRGKGAPLFTVVPLGASPVSAAICSLA